MNILIEKLINLGFSHFVRDEGKENEIHVLNHNNPDLHINIFNHNKDGRTICGVKSYELNIETHTDNAEKFYDSIKRILDDPFQFRVASLKGFLDCIEKFNNTIHPILVGEYGFYRLPFLWEEVSYSRSSEKFKPFLEYTHKKLRQDRLYNLRFYYDNLSTTLTWMNEDVLDPTFDIRETIEDRLSRCEDFNGIIKTPIRIPIEKALEKLKWTNKGKISQDIFDLVDVRDYPRLLEEINNRGLEIV